MKSIALVKGLALYIQLQLGQQGFSEFCISVRRSKLLSAHLHVLINCNGIILYLRSLVFTHFVFVFNSFGILVFMHQTVTISSCEPQRDAILSWDTLIFIANQ